MNLTPKIEFKVIWKDDDCLELRILACNGHYLGSTEVYDTPELIAELASNLKKFPGVIKRKVSYEAGAPDYYALFSMMFYCIDLKGSPAVQIVMEERVADNTRPEERSKLTMEMLFEPAALDTFVSELHDISEKEIGKATLCGIEA